MAVQATREPQYQNCLDTRDRVGTASLGLMTNQVWHDDPRRLTFLLARYKFVSKMFSGMKRVVEYGCADAFGTRIVQQEVPDVTVVDFDPLFIEDLRRRMVADWKVTPILHDVLEGPIAGEFDGAYSLDVLEHIPVADEQLFLGNIAASLKSTGVLIIGSPSLESQPYASPPSKAGHVNCKSGKDLKALLQVFFHNVFLFSMNDEVVHTGYSPMAHYLIGLCCGPKR